MNIETDKIAIITKEREVTFEEVFQHIDHFATLTPKGQDKRTVIFSENCEGWVYAFFSAWQNGSVAVPIDASSTVDDVAYILNDCRPQCVWVSDKCASVLEEAIRRTGLDIAWHLISQHLEEPSAFVKHTSKPWDVLDVPYNQDVALIVYTSGTTGSPKGVMLSFQNLMANVKGVTYDVPVYTRSRRTLMLLPVHHVLPLMGTVVIPFYMGGGIAICPSLTGPDIMDTLCRGKIAIMIGVPRLWQTLYGGIKKKIDSNVITRSLFNLCAFFRSRTLSRLVFSSVRKKMGGCITYCVSGGAALSKEIGEGLRTLGIDVLEGYGMTETAPIICFTRPSDIRPGCVGLPLPGIECKLVNGELCAKGPNVMLGYYNRPEETAAVIDADGYIHTGDMAVIDQKGRVTITGRTKEIIVLSNGKNVEPSEIEYKLEKYDAFVKEAAIVQDGDLLRAIIVPQTLWAAPLTDTQVEVALKRDVIEPFNRSVVNYKKVMGVLVYRGDLPRTKLDKLKRFKLKEILNGSHVPETEVNQEQEPDLEEYRMIKRFIEEEKKVPVRPSSHVETDLAMDSLDKVGLQGFIEHSFGMTIQVEEMANFACIQEMAEFIAKGKTRMQMEAVDWHKLMNENSEGINLPKGSWIYPMGVKMFKGLFRVYNSLSIHGRINIPARGPYILAPNHQSFVDGPVALSGLTWRSVKQCYFYATERHVQGRVVRAMANNNNVIVMEKANLKTSILKLAEVLKLRRNIVIFPEGSRTHDGELGDFKVTFAILSKELNVPIIPVCIDGAYEALPRHRMFLRPRHIDVTYLPPVIPTKDITYAQLAENVKKAIDECLRTRV